MFGLGHGALEAILLAGLPLAGLLVSWVLAAQRKDSSRHRAGGHPPAGGGARLLEDSAGGAGTGQRHGGARGPGADRPADVAAGRVRWLILAIALHFSVNAAAAILVVVLGLSPWIGELVLVAMAAGVLTLGWRLTRRAEESGGPVW